MENTRDFSLQIEDNGAGFEMANVHEKGDGHVGLRIMQERAQRLSAKFEIVSQQSQGTTISLYLQGSERLVA